jgi:hypothetical protein
MGDDSNDAKARFPTIIDRRINRRKRALRDATVYGGPHRQVHSKSLRVGGSYMLPPLTDPTVQISRSGFFKTDSPSRHPGAGDLGSG